MDQTVRLKESFKLALSMVLFYWLALSMNWDLPKYGALAIALISLDTTGASLRKGAMRVVGTTFGLVIGLMAIAMFSQDRWGAMLFFAVYLVAMNYLMQGSRFAYAWFVTGFLPPLIWAATYMNTDTAFHFAAYRYLETTAGVIIFTVVSALLWPRNAGDKLAQQGTDLWADVRQLFGMHREQLVDGELPTAAAKLRAGLSAKTSQLLDALDTAYADTPSVASQKRAWEVLRVNMLAVGDALALWAQTIDESRPLVLKRPDFVSAMDTLDERFGRIGALWHCALDASGTATADDDAGLLRTMGLEVESASSAGLTHYDHAVLMSFRQQLVILDAASRELLVTLRGLAGLDPDRRHQLPAALKGRYRPSFWQSDRLRKAVFPALCFVAGFVFWIFVDPPPGPMIPMMAVSFGMSVILSNMTPQALWKELIVGLIAMTVVAAPLNFLLLPMLSNGYELMALLFVYVFASGYLGMRQPIVKVLLLNMLVVINFTNDQTYSFIGLANGMLMLYLVLSGVATLLMLVGPGRPEQILLRSVSRFFDGCARIVGEFALNRPHDIARSSARRKRYYESMLLPASGRLQSAERNLEYRAFPDNPPERVKGLVDGVHSIRFRMQALDIAYQRFVSRHPEHTELFGSLGVRLQEGLQRVFSTWANFRKTDALGDERAALKEIALELARRLDAQSSNPDLPGESPSEELYSLLGCLRGLIEAMQDTQRSVQQINWSQWSEARF